MSSLKKRNRIYYIRFSRTVDGNRSTVTRSLDTRQKTVAKERQKELDRQVRSGELNPFKEGFEIPDAKRTDWQTVSECISEFIEHKKPDHSRITSKYLEDLLNRWATVMEISEYPIIDMGKKHVEPFILRDGTYRSDKTKDLPAVKPVTMHSNFRRFRTFWNWLLETGRVEVNVCENIKLPKKNVSYVPKMTTEEEFEAILKAYRIHQNKIKKEHWYREFMEQYWFEPAMHLIFETAMRLSEVGYNSLVDHSGLQGHNLIWGDDRIDYIYLQFNKTDRERMIPITDSLNAVLNKYFEHRGIPQKDEYVFINYHGKPVTGRNMYDQFKKYCKQAGVSDKRTMHGLRHRRITSWLESGLSMKEASVMAGHKSIQTTDKVYSHLAADRIKKKILDIEKRKK